MCQIKLNWLVNPRFYILKELSRIDSVGKGPNWLAGFKVQVSCFLPLPALRPIVFSKLFACWFYLPAFWLIEDTLVSFDINDEATLCISPRWTNIFLRFECSCLSPWRCRALGSFIGSKFIVLRLALTSLSVYLMWFFTIFSRLFKL